LGITTSLDDFGVSYSSLTLLHKLPIQQLKLDISFVKYILDDEKSQGLAQGVKQLAGPLKLSLVAEGIENVKQANMLQSYGYENMQGCYFSKPLKFDELIVYLKGMEKLKEKTARLPEEGRL